MLLPLLPLNYCSSWSADSGTSLSSSAAADADDVHGCRWDLGKETKWEGRKRGDTNTSNSNLNSITRTNTKPYSSRSAANSTWSLVGHMVDAKESWRVVGAASFGGDGGGTVYPNGDDGNGGEDG